MRVRWDEARAEWCDPLSELALERFATEVARSILHQGGAATDMEADRMMRALERELAFYQSFGMDKRAPGAGESAPGDGMRRAEFRRAPSVTAMIP